jgi:hypothetical protein
VAAFDVEVNMDATQTQRHDRPVVRLTMVAGLSALGVFLWMLASLLFGSSAAHADTTTAPGDGLLGGVTGTVSKVTDAVAQTATSATAAVAGTTKNVVDAASPVVQKTTATVAKIPIVGAITAPVVKTAQRTVKTVATKVVEPVLAPVVTTVESGVAKPIVAPVVQLVGSVPVVGDLVKATGLDSTLTGVAGAIDSTVGTVVGGTTDIVTGTVIPVLSGDPTASTPGAGPTGGLPGSTPSGPSTGLPGPSASGTSSAGPAPSGAAVAGSPWTPGLFTVASASAVGDTVLSLTRSFAAVAVVSARDAAAAWFPSSSAPGASGSPLGGPTATCAVGGSCSFGSSGAAAGAMGALSILVFAAAYRAWMRRRMHDDRVPHAPVYATDTSPD